MECYQIEKLTKTKWIWILIEKLTVTQVVKIFSALYEIQSYVAVDISYHIIRTGRYILL
jgi:hypothetical protein